jgi:hypothetical protein
MLNGLIPCPICGATPELASCQRRHDFDEAIECPGCGLTLRAGSIGSEQALRSQWNNQSMKIRMLASDALRELTEVFPQGAHSNHRNAAACHRALTELLDQFKLRQTQ